MDRGSVLVFLNGPKDRLEFSLDGVFGRTGAKFDGFYCIPDDCVHLVSYRLASAGEGAFITLIVYPREPTVFVFDWCSDLELFKLEMCMKFVDQTDKLLEYPGLISYKRFMNQQEGSLLLWETFTRFITRESIESVFDELTYENSDYTAYEVTPMIESHHSLLLGLADDNIKRKMIKFIEIPSIKTFGKTCDSKLITQCALDRTPIFKSLTVDLTALISELQISFLLLTFAQNFEGFEQWISILTLLLNSFDLAHAHPSEYKLILNVMREHLEMCPDDFFGGLMNENKLYKMVSDFFSNVKGEFEDEILFYERKFGWKFGEEDSDDEPIIVE